MHLRHRSLQWRELKSFHHSVSFSLVKDLTPITGAENLQVIDISNAEIENYEALFKHTGLKEVRCSEEQKQEILKVNSFPDFEIYT